MTSIFTSTGLAPTNNKFFGLFDAVLRGVSQVMLQNNSYTGLLFLLGISLHSGLQALGVFMGALISTLTALALGVDKADVRAGLHRG